jgi:hypothetical protein
VQRVIVDNWTASAAAAAAGVPERLVVAWVADFRRHGMASLRHRPGRSVTLEMAHLRMLGPFHMLFRGFALALNMLFAPQRRQVQPSPIRRPQDDRREGGF